jgi:hypothetical protein
VKKKTRLTAIFISTLLFSAVAGIELVNLGKSTYLPDQSVQMTFIKADGSVDPESAPILRNGAIYAFVDDIEGYIVVEKSNCVVDGAGYSVGGVYGCLRLTDDSEWIVEDIRNVTVRNTVVNEGGIIFYGHLTSHSVIIDNNTILESKGLDCSGYGNIIVNNTVNGGNGISFAGDRNVIFGNHITNCDKGGSPKPSAIWVGGTYNEVVGNFITGTSGNAIDLPQATAYNNIIAGNQIVNNQVGVHTTYVISQGGAENNIIYYNNFINNMENVYNEAIVTTVVSVNRWDCGTHGNYWSDYGGTDADRDGIGDIIYTIDSTNVDNFPLMAPVDISRITIATLPPIFAPKPTQTPIDTSTPTPTSSPSPSPTPTASSSSSPTEEPKQTEQDMTAGAILAVTSIFVFIGLLFYFIKRK